MVFAVPAHLRRRRLARRRRRTWKDIQEFVDGLRVGPWAKVSTLRLLRSVLELAREDGRIHTNPARGSSAGRIPARDILPEREAVLGSSRRPVTRIGSVPHLCAPCPIDALLRTPVREST